MAETKNAKLTAASVREMKPEDRKNLLAEKRTELREARTSLKAGELANPRKVKELRREIALVLTISSEPAVNQEETK